VKPFASLSLPGWPLLQKAKRGQWNFHRTGEYHLVGAVYLHSLLFSNENMAAHKTNLGGNQIRFVFSSSPKARLKLWKGTGCPGLAEKRERGGGGEGKKKRKFLAFKGA
jgi:hypothetical protein